jgi:hypothetical protein
MQINWKVPPTRSPLANEDTPGILVNAGNCNYTPGECQWRILRNETDDQAHLIQCLQHAARSELGCFSDPPNSAAS